MKNDKEAIKALGWLAGFPILLYFVLFWLEGSIADINSLHFLLVALFFPVMIAADQLLKYARFEPDNGLVHIRRRFEGLAMSLTMLALVSYPNVFRQHSELNDFTYAFVGFGFVAAVIGLFHLSMISSRRFVFKQLLLIGFRIGSGSAVLALLIGYIMDMTWEQMLWYFMVALGVLSNTIFPGNTKLEARMAKATPFARRVNRFVERLAFASGMTLLVALPFVGEGALTVSGVLVVVVVVYLGHWVFTRHRDEKAVFQHR